MHVVQVRYAKRRGDRHADVAALFVRMDRIVALGGRPAQRGHGQREIERDFRQRGSNPHIPDERRTQAAKDAQPGHRHVAAERVGHEVNRMAELEKRPNAVVFAERRSPGLEKRLRSDHEDFHDAVR